MRSFSPVQCYKDGSKEMRLSLSVTRRSSNSRKQLQNAESVVGRPKQSHGVLEKSKDIPKYTLFQQAYHTNGSIPTSRCGDLKKTLSFQNKGNVSLYNTVDQSSIAVERRHKMPAKKSMMVHDLHRTVLPQPTTNIYHHMIDDVKNTPPCHTQYLTYHLEKFPFQQKREALSEKKRVALLKLLAQQLVSRLDATETHPSYLLDGNVQAHAVMLRSNLQKFQRELHAAVKALEGSFCHGSPEKCRGYIVLPSKLERIRSSEVTLTKQPKGSQKEGLDSMQKKDSLNKETAFLYHDSSSETTTSFSSVSFDSSSPQKAKQAMGYKVLNRDSSRHKKLPDSLAAYEESSRAVLEPETQDNMFQDFESRLQSFPLDSKCEPTNQVKGTWDHQLLNKELEKLDAEIKETKSRMARNLFLTHPPLADTSYVTSSLSSSPRCSDNAASLLEGNSSVNTTLVHATTEEIVVLPSLTKETVRLQQVSDAPNKLKAASLDDKISREIDDPTLVTNMCVVDEKNVKNDVKLKMREGETVSANHVVDYCKIDVELPLHAAMSSITSPITSLETSSCIDTKRQSGSSMEASSTYPSVRKVEVSQVAPEPNNAGGLTILFKKDMETNQKVLVDIITEALMQELLDYELSDMVLHGRSSSPIKRMKEDILETASMSVEAPTLYPLLDTSNSPCRSAFASLKPAQEISDVCVTGSSNTYDDYQNYQAYYDFTTEKCSSPVMGSPEIYRESFKMTSKQLVDKYVKENLEAHGFLCAWSLLELYASGKTSFLVLGKQCLDGGEQEEQLYGKMILEALCECLDKKYLRFCLPSFFLFRQPCLEGPYLQKTLISNINEHADAACEGGFSLEYILEKSLDEEDWKTPYHEMMGVLHNISEYVMMDMIDNFLHDLMEEKHLACASQVALEFMHSTKLEALRC